MRILLFITLFILSACAGSKKAIAPYEPQATDRLTLQRTGCYGTCPIYELTIFGNGIVLYEGKRYTDKIGKYVATLDSVSVSSLFNQALRLKWEEYPDEFPIDNVDFPQFFLGIVSENMDRKVKGNNQAPAEILQLSEDLDSLTFDLSWQVQ